MIKKVTGYLLLTIFFPSLLNAQDKIKIACVGNSITYGAGVANKAKNAYPAQLQAMLGEGYEVMNFGESGTTLLKQGNKPYWETQTYTKALQSKPNIVFIMLGTNDSKAINRPYYRDFEKDYKAFIESFRQLPTEPRIVLLAPIPSFLEDSNAIYNPVIKTQIIPSIQQVAYETSCEIINLYPLFIDKPDLLIDKVHPSSLGATLIAKRLYEAVQWKEARQIDIFSTIKEEKTRSSFYGFECIDFVFNNHPCKIVKPKKPTKGLPWVWRARFWGHEPQTDIALLERGFHLVYCDVSESYGNQEALNAWNHFYTYMQQCGLAKKAVLEGMSRGGIYIYNWALANPGKVASIYADAPVLDLKSWPGGKGKGPGSKEDWEIFKKDYRLSEEQALSFNNSPIDNAKKIASLHFPILHVVGDADEVVPVAENTQPFEIAVKQAGGNIRVIHKPGIGHHPHSLQNPSPIVDFILESVGIKTNFAALAAPGAEYRSGAGWKEGADWWKQKEDIDSLLLAEKRLDILFLGNSITQGIAGHRPQVTYKPGLAIFDSVFKNHQWECAGISGDRTQNILWRLQHGAYGAAKPKIVVLTIGVNNFPDDNAAEISTGIAAILKYMKRNMPSAKIILIGPLPAGLKKGDPMRLKYEQVQSIIQRYKGKGLHYLPLADTFIQSEGNLNPTLCAGDGIHLLPAGYLSWASAMQPVIKALLK